MTRKLLTTLALSFLMSTPNVSIAQNINMKWGLENTYSYYEVPEGRVEGEDLTIRRPESTSQQYRAFAFAEGSSEIREPWLACIDSVMRLWDIYRRDTPNPTTTTEASRSQFQAYVAREDPKCMGRFKRTAPSLYFDFITDTSEQFVLERVEVTTLEFAEYRGGGFAKEQEQYDILLSHLEGVKSYLPEPRLIIKEHGRVELRLWSDNFYPGAGWIAPMGEYTIDIRFVFSKSGKEVTVSTGPFKIDV